MVGQFIPIKEKIMKQGISVNIYAQNICMFFKKTETKQQKNTTTV
jgi:GTP cyclohydrolase I